MILDGDIQFTYESWVRPPVPPNVVYTYGRCVSTLNGRDVVITWDEAQMHGPAKKSAPLLSTFSFVTEATRDTPSQLRYGISNQPRGVKRVNFLANQSELGQVSQLDAVIHTAPVQAISTFRVPTEYVVQTSSGERLERTAILSLSFISYPGQGQFYKYELKYELIDPGPSDPFLIPGDLFLRPTPEIMRRALAQSNGNIILTGKAGSHSFQGPPFRERAGSTVMLVSAFDVVQRGEVIARFPVSYYAPVEPFNPGIAQQDPKVRPGTVLARLVAEASSHPEMLAIAAEAPPRIDIPAWLRAHYRRNHSEMSTVAVQSDPTGGYPIALESLYVWMLRHQDLQPSPAPELRAAAPSVGQNRRISGAGGPRSESDIRINVNNPQQIIAGSNNLGNGRQAQFFSSDGGSGWGQTTLPLLSSDSVHSDPTVAWTPDGTAWATTIGINADTTVLQMRAYKSTDGGQNWTFDGTFSGDQTSAAKQMMWVDLAPTSPFRDRIYVIWYNGAPAFTSYRSSAGWHPPIRLSGVETTGAGIGSDITTNAAGHVLAVWPDTGSRGLFLVRSTDGGNTFSTPRLIARTFGTFQVSVPATADRSALVRVSIGAFQDNIYVTWLDLSGDDGCRTSSNEPKDNVNSDCKSRVWFSSSSDGGVTWSIPTQINPEGTRSDQFNQRLAVDQETGVLGIVY
jgi:hypothetical protein